MLHVQSNIPVIFPVPVQAANITGTLDWTYSMHSIPSMHSSRPYSSPATPSNTASTPPTLGTIIPAAAPLSNFSSAALVLVGVIVAVAVALVALVLALTAVAATLAEDELNLSHTSASHPVPPNPSTRGILTARRRRKTA
jgi:hypothetical protein